MTTATAIATELTVPSRPDGGFFYGPTPPASEVYTVSPAPSFKLALERTEAAWIVRDRETGIFGAGDVPSDAVKDFLRAAREHLDVLVRQEALSDDLLAQLDYLRTRIA